MAEVDDRWWKTVKGAGDKRVKVKSASYGKGNRWRARWYDERGAQREKHFRTFDEAKGHAATVEADLRRMTYIDPEAGKVTFRAYAEVWRAGQIHEESTAAQVETHLRRHVYPVFGDRQLASIRPSEAQAWVRRLETAGPGRSALMPATVQVIVRYAVAIMHAAVADKRIPANPFVKLSRTRPVKKRVTPPTGEQVEAMRLMMPPRLRALTALGAGCGLRQGEAFAVEPEAVDFLHHVLHVRQQLVLMPGGPPFLRLPKGRKTREVPLGDEPAAMLAAHIAEFPTQKVWIEDRTNPVRPVWRWAELLFTFPAGEAIRRTSFSSSVWRPGRRAANLPSALTFHDMRHFYASAVIRTGDVKAAQEALGHASAQETLDTYGHLWVDSKARARAAIDAAFRGDVGPEWGASPAQAG